MAILEASQSPHREITMQRPLNKGKKKKKSAKIVVTSSLAVYPSLLDSIAQ